MTDPWLEQFAERRKAREEADRSFDLLGERLVVRASIAPEAALRLAQFDIRLARWKDEVDEAERLKKEPPPLGVTDEEMLAMDEEAIRAALEPESWPAWDRLRAPDAAEPLSLLEIHGLSRYVVSRVSGLPTERPAGSSAGPQNGASSSKAKSGSRAAGRKR